MNAGDPMCYMYAHTNFLILPSQYYRQPETQTQALHYMNTTFVALFGVEAVLKIYAYGFRVRHQSGSRKTRALHLSLCLRKADSLLRVQNKKDLWSLTYFFFCKEISILQGETLSEAEMVKMVVVQESFHLHCLQIMKWVLHLLENTMNHSL